MGEKSGGLFFDISLRPMRSGGIVAHEIQGFQRWLKAQSKCNGPGNILYFENAMKLSVIETRVEFEIIETAIYDGAFRKKTLGVLLQKRNGIIVRRVNQVGGKARRSRGIFISQILKKEFVVGGPAASVFGIEILDPKVDMLTIIIAGKRIEKSCLLILRPGKSGMMGMKHQDPQISRPPGTGH